MADVPAGGDGPTPLPPPGLAVNQRRGALRAAAALLGTGAAEIAAAYARVTASLRAGAWEGTAAEAWAGDLARSQASVQRALSDAALRCTGAAGAQPPWVPAGDLRATAPRPTSDALPEGR